jgi:predicted dehydrogenase
MINIAMMGCDSSHTESYALLINKPGSPFYDKAQIQWLWGQEPSQAQKKAEICDIPQIVQNPEEAIIGADLVMVCNRFGDDHFEPARLAIEAGKPTFVDKPFTNDPQQARDLRFMAEDRGVPLISFSPLRFATEMQEVVATLPHIGLLYGMVITGPAEAFLPDPRAKSLYFYGSHAVDMMKTLVKKKLETPKVLQSEKGIWVQSISEDGMPLVINMPYHVTDHYHVAIYAQKQTLTQEIDASEQIYERSLEVLFDNFMQGDMSPAPIQEAVEGIELIDMIEKAVQL